jgi:hypothetical protein
MELNLCHFPNDTFLGQDTGVMKLDVVIQAFAVLSHSRFLV